MADYIKVDANPVGTAYVDENIDNFVKIMSAEWDATKETIPWYAFWRKVSLTKVTNFMLSVLDDLIAYVDDLLDEVQTKRQLSCWQWNVSMITSLLRLYQFG